ncbi:MAG: STAS domain-containing protein [Deltaproteobacteria bacterium]|nr:STAS domain-containing protein [Deltaproteobacteria bacterium]
MNITITIEKQAKSSIVHVSGKIDATTADELENAMVELLEEQEKNIILDMEGTNYISSAGLRVLIVIAKQMYDSGHFCLCNASDNVQEIIQMSGFNVFMSIYDDLSTAKEMIAEE